MEAGEIKQFKGTKSKTQVCEAYSISASTFKRWIKRSNLTEVIKNKGSLLTPAQVNQIVNAWGNPY